MATYTLYTDPSATGLATGASWADAFTSWSNLVTYLNTNIVSGNTYDCYFRQSGLVQDTTAVDLSSLTMNSTTYVNFIADSTSWASSSGIDTSKYILDYSGSSHAVELDTGTGKNISFQGLQIRSTPSVDYVYGIFFGGTNISTDSIVFDSCWIEIGSCSVRTSPVMFSVTSQAGIYAKNSYFINKTTSTTYGCFSRSKDWSEAEFYFCLFEGTGTSFGLFLSNSTGTVVNNCIFSNTTSEISGTGTVTEDYNATVLVSGGTSVLTGSNDVFEITLAAEFSDPTNYDYTLLATGSLYQAGTPISGITVDIDGEIRDTTNPCLGPDEYGTPLVTASITYSGNSNDGGTAPVDPSSPYTVGSNVTVLGNTGTLTRTGYIWVCWNTASDGTGTNYEAADTFTITADTTLYALWKTEAELIDAYLNPPSSGSGHRARAKYIGIGGSV